MRLLVALLPWPLKRWLLCRLYGYELDPASHIGLAWIFPRRLVMKKGASIGHFTVCKGLDLLELGEHAIVGRLNWITGYPANLPPHFTHLPSRRPMLRLGEHAAITHRHIIDCTDEISIGRFTTVAGFRSQLLTHSIDFATCRQHANPIRIGEYCFIGTASTLLPGTVVPHHCIVGANALLNKQYAEPYHFYAGVPASAVSRLEPGLGYFRRTVGFVH